MVHPRRASIELWMHAGSWESTREAFEWHEAKPSASLASRVLSQLPKCIHNSIDAQLKHGQFLLEHCQFKRKLIKYRILLDYSDYFDWLNAITWFDRRMGVRLSRFRCTLVSYKMRAKNCQLCLSLNIIYVCFLVGYCGICHHASLVSSSYTHSPKLLFRMPIFWKI